MYTPTEFSTVADKVKFEKQFKKFVNSDFKKTLFPKWFYTRLSMTFGHIAHYNQAGFYAHFFEDADGRAEFIHQCAKHHCCGDPAFTFSDVERVLVQWLKKLDKSWASM